MPPAAWSCPPPPPPSEPACRFLSQDPLLGPGHLHRTKRLTSWGSETDRAGPQPWLDGQSLRLFFYALITIWVLCLLLCDLGNYCYFPLVFISNSSIFRAVKNVGSGPRHSTEESKSGSPLMTPVILGEWFKLSVLLCPYLWNSSSWYPPSGLLGIL